MVGALLRWFGRNARDLPWRRSKDPYGIWISEVMLQQTQVTTVVPYWKRWMRVLPTVHTLAKAPTEQVLKLWEGLGYYHRARNLQRAAQLIVNAHAGEFPRTYDHVLSLPGIGPYTAGAICSIAFGQPTPVVDGNVTRVLCRVFAISGNVRVPRTNKRLWALASELVQTASAGPDGRNCGALNEALMELGALVCTPKTPQCELCPVRSYCAARRSNRVHLLPRLGKRPAATHRRFLVFVARSNGHCLVRQRPSGVVNAELWEFPNLEVTPGSSAMPKEVAAQCLGLKPRRVQSLGVVNHTITRYRIRIDAYEVDLIGAPAIQSAAGIWTAEQALSDLAFASAHRKILRILDGK